MVRVLPKVADQPDHVQPRAISLQNQEAPFPVHGIERLFQVQEDPVEGLLLKVCKLLQQLGLQYRRPNAAPTPTPM